MSNCRIVARASAVIITGTLATAICGQDIEQYAAERDQLNPHFAAARQPATTYELNAHALSPRFVTSDSLAFRNLSVGARVSVELEVGKYLALEVLRVADVGPETRRLHVRLDGVEHSSGIIVIHEGHLGGSIYHPQLGRFAIDPTGDPEVVAVYRVDPNASFPCGVEDGEGVRPNHEAKRHANAPESDMTGETADDGGVAGSGPPVVLDLQCWATTASIIGAGGRAALETDIHVAVGLTSDAFANSGLNIEVRFDTLLENGEQPDTNQWSGVLNAMRNGSEPYWIGVPCIRDRYGADLVCLIMNQPGLSPTGTLWDGLATGLGNPDGDDTNAFLIVSRLNLTSSTVLAHEIGHTLGCAHQHGNAGSGVFSWSRAHTFMAGGELRSTIMYSQNNDSIIPHFSNPDVSFMGVPTGVPIGQSGEADNRATIIETMNDVSDYRVYPSPWETIISGSNTATSSATQTGWGRSIAFAHSLLVVGLPYWQQTIGTYAGRIAVYNYDSADCDWDFLGYVGSDLPGSINFGADVDTDGRRIIVRRYRASSGYSAEIFDAQNLLAPSETIPIIGNILPISISDDCATIGTRLYRRNNSTGLWNLELNAESGGDASAVKGSVAAFARTPNDNNIGKVFRREASTGLWTFDGNLREPSGGYALPYDMSIDGDRIAVARWWGNQGSTVAIYRYTPNAANGNWTLEQNIGAGSYYPRVALSGGLLVVGTWGTDPNRAGALHVYRYEPSTSSWVTDTVLNELSGVCHEWDGIGGDVALWGGTLFAGSSPTWHGTPQILNERVIILNRYANVPPPPTTCPHVTTAPDGATIVAGGTHQMFVEAVGTGPLGYSWKRNGQPVTDGPGGVGPGGVGTVTGANSPLLTINNMQDPDGGEFRCIVQNACGSEESLGALVFVVQAPQCPLDIAPPGGDGVVGIADLLMVIGAWGVNPGHAADVTGDGVVGIADLLAVIGAWGACP